MVVMFGYFAVTSIIKGLVVSFVTWRCWSAVCAISAVLEREKRGFCLRIMYDEDSDGGGFG